MRIKVLREFSGRITREQRIYPGEYTLDDPALFGAGQYLLDNDFAEQIPLTREDPEFHEFIAEVTAHMHQDDDEDIEVAGEVADEPVDVSNEAAVVDYSDFTIAELKDLLDERGIDYSDAKRKDDYIALAEAQG